MTRIDVLGALDREPLQAHVITNVLDQSDGFRARYGEQFTGRPGTGLFVDDQYVIKVRGDYVLPESTARRFIEKALEKERLLSVYHPAKTWFLAFEPEVDHPWIANITPRLMPLHNLVEVHDTRLLPFVEKVMEIYLRIGASKDVSLDISLSNFACDDADTIYYVDDDVYPWDNFNAFSNFLVHLVRAGIFPSQTEFARLGTCARDLVTRYFDDPHWLMVIAESIESQFVGSDRRDALQALCGAIRQNRPVYGEARVSPTVVALLGDVHANAPALEAVLEYLSGHGVTEYLVLGDIVGYGPHPAACIELIRDSGMNVIKGNHDHAVATGRTSIGFSATGRWVVDWTREQLTAGDHEWLASLPLCLKNEQWLAVHGAPSDRTFFNAYVYEMTYEENLDALEQRQVRFCFHGHTHLQQVYYRLQHRDGKMRHNKVDLAPFSHALLCPGSVGQPRSGRPGAEFALLDTHSWSAEFHHISYRMDATLSDMRAMNFPSALIQRLEQGL